MESSSEQSKYSKRYTPEEMEKDIVALLQANSHGLNINQISQMLDINRNTISKWLKTLEAKNKIVSRKSGVSNVYYKSGIRDISPGPYVLTIEYDQKVIIKKVNETYLNRLNEIKESLIGMDLYRFYPFNEMKDEFTEFLKEAVEQLNNGEEGVSKELSISNPDGKIETYSFKITIFSEKDDHYNINFEDLTLLKLMEEQLLNSGSILKILNLISDNYISIQSQDHKVIMANKKTLNDLNNGRQLTSEPIFCYDLFRNKSSECEDCIGKLAIKKGQKQQTTYKVNGKEILFEAIPIESSETSLKGYILISKK